MQVARGGVREQFLIGHARPEEVAQAAGQIVVRQRPDARPHAGQIEPVAEVGGHQHADDRVADRVLMVQAVFLAEDAVKRGHALALVVVSGRR